MRASRRRTFAQAAAQRFVASISQESVPCVSLHALRHHRLRRCAARPAALTGWALQAGCRHPLWLPYGGLLKLATSAVRASARGLLSLGPQIAHKSVSLPSAQFFFFRCAGQGAFRRRKVVREGGRAENDCRYVQQVLKDAARRGGSENQGAVAQFSTGPERQVAGHQSSGFAAAHTPSGRGSSHAPDWDWDSD